VDRTNVNKYHSSQKVKNMLFVVKKSYIVTCFYLLKQGNILLLSCL